MHLHSTPEQRFWSKVIRADYCWLWQGSLNSAGYGSFGGMGAHCYSYQVLHGPIPSGMEIDHLCQNKRCVNPQHMEVVSHRENCLRAGGWAAKHSNATHCPAGHPYDEGNTQRRRGRRYCKKCVRAYDNRRHDAAYWREYRARRRARAGLDPVLDVQGRCVGEYFPTADWLEVTVTEVPE